MQSWQTQGGSRGTAGWVISPVSTGPLWCRRCFRWRRRAYSRRSWDTCEAGETSLRVNTIHSITRTLSRLACVSNVPRPWTMWIRSSDGASIELFVLGAWSALRRILLPRLDSLRQYWLFNLLPCCRALFPSLSTDFGLPEPNCTIFHYCPFQPNLIVVSTCTQGRSNVPEFEAMGG